MKYTLFILAICLFVSCSKDEEADYTVKNETEIQDYITTHNLNAKKSSTGLYYVIDEAGTGKQAMPNSYVNVTYKGYYTDGRVFDESNSDGIFTHLQQVIKGWTEGISYFKEGGNGKLLIPSHLAYGNSDYGSVPGGSVLIFDIQLKTVYDNLETCLKAKNETEIKTYIEKNKLDAQKCESGLYYVIEEEGTGIHPNAESNVTIAYKGYFTNDKVFDQSSSNGISIGLNDVIKGWTEGIPYFKEGGKGKLLIPSHLGYGANGGGPIPGGTVLIFDVNLIKVNE
ncbi:FKBP-type peptidyl-prolyl isomerase-like protein [Ancylomarina subtilis]|uniref:Peptidyl-prolyl cis-trans isomerase n=1 Tax=Ancylomarina subtilis TaxID=1639035 RepID=A0A4V2FT57_9BACT|nr:FKBP-type peptidyl-prolyl cis-trans isomerase [Ancylomarina subtilis]RZT96815.1 FKBP-type peptidyl-prolyl isomerase-like protein [Ancylomarina subtilis]